ncbi:MAG: LysM peptidoglycan-binding domain-containing protein [Proteobacteria bacterium]|nr:LysM peptidoglycan-binding domain-containing protein [Pseudomonadota bacterium]
MPMEKAVITNTVTGDRIPVMFNPTDYTVNQEVNYAQSVIPGLSGPVLQFVSGNMQTLEMELFLDTNEEHRVGNRIVNRAQEDVRTLTRQITGLMSIQPSTHAPPVLLFTWASLSFTCVLARAQQKFVMFLPDGTPVRARLQVVFNEFRNVDLEAKEVKRETADFTKVHVVNQGETLSGIAAQEYGDPALWRVIALANAVDRPRRLTSGQELRLPSLPYRDPDSGTVYS